MLKPLRNDVIAEFIHKELDKVGLAHTTFTEAAIDLIARHSEGILRQVKNLCVGSMIEAVRHNEMQVDIRQVNTVLIQPHWRLSRDHEKQEGVKLVNEKPNYDQ